MTINRSSVKSLLAVVAVAVVIMSCAGSRSATERTLSQPMRQQLSADARTRFDMAFLEAVNKHHEGDYSAAYDLFQYCLSLDTTVAEVYDYLLPYLVELGEDKKAMEYAARTTLLAPDNLYYAESYSRGLLQNERYAEAAEVLQRIVDRDHTRTDLLEMLMKVYFHLDNTDAALRTIEKMETLEGSSESTTLAKMYAYELKGDKEKQKETLQAFVERYPYEPNYRVMLGNWYMNNDMTEQAFEEISNVLKDEPGNLAAKSSLIEYYQRERQDSVAEKMIIDIVGDRKVDNKARVDYLVELAKLHLSQNRDSAETLQLFDRLIENNSDMIEFRLVKISFMERIGMADESLMAEHRNTLSIAPELEVSRFALLELLWKNQKYDEVIAVSSEGNDYNPDNMAFYYYLAMAYYQKDDTLKALDALERGVDQIKDDTNADLATDFFVIMGDVQHKLGNNQKAYEAYDKCLQWKADNYYCLNNYAYFLAIDGGDLAKAETMSRKTIEAEPSNATFLDTFAWILFLEGKNEEARAYIDRVIMSADNESDIVMEHVGDIYAACGLIDEAVEYWNKAFDRTDDEALLKEKIQKRRYIAPRK